MSDNENGLIVIHTCLALMRELEDSLRSSQAALLERDAATTERCTQEQEGQWRQLRILLANPISSSTISEGGDSRLELPACPPELAGQLHTTAISVQHLARVQLALLRRSQHFLNVLANWLASPETLYGPPQIAGGVLYAVPHAHRGL